MSGSSLSSLPLYQCHKQVRAAKITGIMHGNTCLLELDGAIPVEVGGEYMLRHQPKVGGYFVEYADGYQSFSPAEAFESGYVRVTE